jgi:glycine cleavage system P protein (glycine dehydrogenase) subunit 1
MGKQGLRKVAELCYHKAHYAADQIGKLDGYKIDTRKPYFNEFVIKCLRPISEINAHLLQQGIIGGYDLGKDYPDYQDNMLLAVTEMNTKEEIDALVTGLRGATNL